MADGEVVREENANPQGEVVTKKMEEKPKTTEEAAGEKANPVDIPKMDLAKFFDIIGQIDIILPSDTSLRFGSTIYPYDSVPPGEFVLSTVDRLPMLFKIIGVGDDASPWVLTDFPNIESFTNFDGYLLSLWKLLVRRLDDARRVLIAPSSTMWEMRNPDPGKLGYPTNEILKVNARTTELITHLLGNIQLRDADDVSVAANVCGDLSGLEAHNVLMDNSRVAMAAMHPVLQRMLNLVSAGDRCSNTLPVNSASNHFN